MAIKDTTSQEKLNFWNEEQHLNDLGISFFVDALKLDRVKEIPDDIRSHVESCHRCKSEIWGLYELLKDQDYSGQGTHPFFGEGVADWAGADKELRELKTGEWKFIFRIAAIVLISSTLGLYLFIGKFGSNGSKPEIAENFTPSPNLEDLVGESYRAYSTEVLSPENGRNYNGAIDFRWESDYEGPLVLKILNNKEKVVGEFVVLENQLHFKENLPPGLYYWKLETEDELLYIGKFYVGKPE